jgi:hypothetical protein
MVVITLTTSAWLVVAQGSDDMSALQMVHHYQGRCCIPTLLQLVSQDQ